jgi:hypothetical protein
MVRNLLLEQLGLLLQILQLCLPLEADITQEVLQKPNSNSKPLEVLERTDSMTDVPVVILESTNLDQVVELSDSQYNLPCSIELFPWAERV